MKRRIPHIRLHFSFLVFTALLFLMRSNSLIINFSAVCAVHEAGHIIAAQLCGKRVAAVDITGFGIRMETDRSCISPVSHDAFILLAGPAVNLVIYILPVFYCLGEELRLLSLAAALYNLLPYRQLDGGALIALFTEGTVTESAIVKILTIIKILISLLLLTLTFHTGLSALPLFITSVILLVNDIK